MAKYKKIVTEFHRCPKCGTDAPIVTNPDKPGWLMATCKCNPIGPTYEAPIKKQEADE